MGSMIFSPPACPRTVPAPFRASWLPEFQIVSPVQTVLPQVSPHGAIRILECSIELRPGQAPPLAGVGVGRSPLSWLAHDVADEFPLKRR